MTAPSLFCAHRVTALNTISQIPQPYRDNAYDSICDFLFRKQPPSDPYYSSRGDGYPLSFEEAVDICELLKLMETDNTIYAIIENIADSLAANRNRDKFTRQQKNDLADRIETIILVKLPDSKNIGHEGYKIAALTQVARIRQAGRQVWDLLIQSARSIPNVADRAYVLCIIAVALPPKESLRRSNIIEEGKTLIDAIPADLDRIDRYIQLAEMTAGSDPTMSKRCLKAAMEFSLSATKSEVVYPSQKRIIDLAHRIDENYAASLASLVDDDPARTGTKRGLKAQLKLLEAKKEMTHQTSSKLDPSRAKSDYPQAAWMNLGGLNANRVEPIHFDFVRQYIEASAGFSIQESYPILAWIIENAIRRVGNTDQARTFLIPMFDATLLGAELAGRIAARSLLRFRELKKHAIKLPSDMSVIIKAGERENALRFVREWVSNEVRDYLKICDPFFGIDDLEVLQMIRSVNPTCKVFILTSKKQQDGYQQPLDETFRTHWRIRISDQDPPETEIAVVGTETNGELPIHDRWWITKGSGLRVGTSYNSLGIKKTSDISMLSMEEAELHEKEVDQYLHREKKEHNKEKLRYYLFTL